MFAHGSASLQLLPVVWILLKSLGITEVPELQIFSVVSDRITRTFNRSRATPAVTRDISKDFDRVRHTGLLHKLISYGSSGQIFGLISSFLGNRRL